MTLNEYYYFDKSSKRIGKNKNVPNSYFDKKELKIGVEVEMEHTDDEEIALEIAKDHLCEDKYYYSKLKNMEKKFKNKKGKK